MNSDKADDVVMSEEKLFYMNKLRDFMFENVYHSKKVKKDEELDKIKHMIFPFMPIMKRIRQVAG